jgi:DNA-binding NarL/FixJ family response regulator
MDGSGYHRGLAGPSIGQPARILGAADAYYAMTQPRSWRAALDGPAAASQLRDAAGAGQFDGDAVDAVLTAAGHGVSGGRRGTGPSTQLTPREVEVLRLLARGSTAKDIGRALGISPRTVHHHIEHIYDKLGVSTRGAAALYAIQQGYFS